MAADINCDKKQSCIYKYLNKILLQLNYQYSVIYNYNMLARYGLHYSECMLLFIDDCTLLLMSLWKIFQLICQLEGNLFKIACLVTITNINIQ